MDAQVVSLLSAEFLASKDRGKHHMLKDPRQYDFYVNINKHKPLSCLPCPTSTILAYNILMRAHVTPSIRLYLPRDEAGLRGIIALKAYVAS